MESLVYELWACVFRFSAINFQVKKRGEELLLVLQSLLGFESSRVGSGKETDITVKANNTA